MVDQENEVTLMGRPSKFSPTIQDIILGMAKHGLTDSQMAGCVGVTEQTLNNWKIAHPDFFESLKHEKAKADMIVADCLFKKATGAIKTKEVQSGIDTNTGNIVEMTKGKEHLPDTTSMIFWLKNRDQDRWRDKVETAISADEDTLKLAYSLGKNVNTELT
jgi:hypothetical protein